MTIKTNHPSNPYSLRKGTSESFETTGLAFLQGTAAVCAVKAGSMSRAPRLWMCLAGLW